MENLEILELTSNAWCENAYIETTEHIIKGQVFVPKIAKKHRLFSELLNGNKNFIAVKNCSIEYKNSATREVEKFDFIQVNTAPILIIRPLYE